MGCAFPGARDRSGPSSPVARDTMVLEMPFFHDMELKDRQLVKKLFTRQEYTQGQEIFKQGESKFGIYVIVSGEVEIYVEVESKDEDHHHEDEQSQLLSEKGAEQAPLRANEVKQSQQSQRKLLAVKGMGQYFGDMALVDKQVFAPVTAVAVSDASILQMTTTDYKKAVKENPNLAVHIMNAPGTSPIRVKLNAIPFFRDIPELQLMQLQALTEFDYFKAGKTICRQGDEADGLYYILKGTVNVACSGEEGPVHLAVLGEGDLFGEIALIKKTTRTATVVAIQKCSVLKMRRDNFKRFLDIFPAIRNSQVFADLINKRTASSLKAIPIFKPLLTKELGPLKKFDSSKLSLLENIFRYMQIETGTTLFREGDVADAFYFIVNGECAVTTTQLSEACNKREADQLQPKRTGSAASSKAEGKQAAAAAAAEAAAAEEAAAAAEGAAAESRTRGSSSQVASEIKAITLSTLKKNDWLGEVSLLQDSRRTATVTAMSKCLLLKLEKKNFSSFLQLVPGAARSLENLMYSRTSKQLRKIPFFALVQENKPWSKLDLLGTLFKFEEFKAGDIVVKLGDKADKFYIVVHGELEATATTLKGNKTRFSCLGPSDWFGEIALLHNTTRTATVKCTADCLLLSLTKEDFQKFGVIAPEVLNHFRTLMETRTAATLSTIHPFDEVKENRNFSKLDLLASMLEFKQFEAKSVVLNEGVKADRFFVLLSGKVVMTEAAGESEEKEETKRTILKQSAYFGHKSLIDDTPVRASYWCVERCVFLTLSKLAFFRMLEVAPEIAPVIGCKDYAEQHRSKPYLRQRVATGDFIQTDPTLYNRRYASDASIGN